jgi:DNA mismatch repair protein MutL
MLIDQCRARERVLYEDLLNKMQTQESVTQKQLFPKQLQITAKERSLLLEMMEDLVNIGFNISLLGKESISINGVPGELADTNPELLLEQMLKIYMEETNNLKLAYREHLALAIARASSNNFIQKLDPTEMKTLFFRLMGCPVHNYSPDGKKIINIITLDALEKLLN